MLSPWESVRRATDRRRRGSRNWIAPADGSTAIVVKTPGRYVRHDLGHPRVVARRVADAFSVEPNRAFVIEADGAGDVEPIDDLTYGSGAGVRSAGKPLVDQWAFPRYAGGGET